MSNDKPTIFRLKTESKPAPIEDAGYTIHKLTGAQRDQLNADSARRFELNADGKTGTIKDFIDLNSFVVSLGLKFEGKPVKIETIREWPFEAVEGVANAIREYNGLNKKEDEKDTAAKKD